MEDNGIMDRYCRCVGKELVEGECGERWLRQGAAGLGAEVQDRDHELGACGGCGGSWGSVPGSA